jgi:hypothetical protein
VRTTAIFTGAERPYGQAAIETARPAVLPPVSLPDRVVVCP